MHPLAGRNVIAIDRFHQRRITLRHGEFGDLATAMLQFALRADKKPGARAVEKLDRACVDLGISRFAEAQPPQHPLQPGRFRNDPVAACGNPDHAALILDAQGCRRSNDDGGRQVSHEKVGQIPWRRYSAREDGHAFAKSSLLIRGSAPSWNYPQSSRQSFDNAAIAFAYPAASKMPPP